MPTFYLLIKIFLNFLILEREEKREGERERLICFSTYLCIYWLLLVCALTRDRTHNLGESEQCSNQVSYLARAYSVFKCWLVLH